MTTTRTPRRFRGSRHQRGAVAVFVAVSMVALIAILLLVLDVGRLYYAQRQLQLDANMAALAGAQASAGCLGGKGKPGDSAAIVAAVQQSLTNNRGTAASMTDLGVPAPPTFVTGDGFSAVSLAPGADSVDSAVEAGRTVLSTDGKTRTFKSLTLPDSDADSVRVTLAAQQPKSFLMRFFGTASTKYLYASATAQQQALGSFYLGTEIANVNGGLLNDVLGGLLCAPGDTACQNSIVGLDVGDSLKGLVGVDLSLGQLATAAGINVTDVSSLLSAQTTLPSILNGLSGVLANVGTGTSSAAATLLQNLAAATTNPNSIPLGSILGSVADVAPNVPFVDLPSLIVALGEAAQKTASGNIQSIELPVAANIPGVVAVKTFLQVGQPPKFSGPVQADSPKATSTTAEVTLTTRLQVSVADTVTNILNGLLAILGTSIDVGPINLGIDVHVAPASATLEKLQCPSVGPPPTALTAHFSADTAVATVNIGTYSGDPSTNPALATSLSPIVSAEVTAVLGLASANVDVDLKNPLSTTVGTGGGDLDPIDQFKPCVAGSTDATCATAGGTPPLVPYFLAWGAPKLPYTTAGAPTDAPDNPRTIGSVDLLSSSATTLAQSLLTNDNLTGDPDNPSQLCILLVACVNVSSLVNPLATGVIAALTPVLIGTTGVVDTLLDPLLSALGVHVGVATVTMNSATFANPIIVTNCLPGVTGDNACPPVPAT